MKKNYSRREFIRKNSVLGAGAFLSMGVGPSLYTMRARNIDTPAILGGDPVRSHGWPTWPVWKPEVDEGRLLEVIRSGVWSRSSVVSEFEEKWADTVGAKRCLAVVNGTNAMICSLVNLGIGAGDEVLVPPYTFIAVHQAILQTGAMPVFVDTDRETFQIDAEKMEEKITPRTRAILPVHIFGLPANMKRIMEIAKKHNLVVVEDACQAWLAEIDGQQVGTFGHSGCYSFQNSKHLAMGEGGAIVSNDDAFMDRCYSYHNFGSQYRSVTGGSYEGRWVLAGSKLRLTEYQAAIGLAQLARLEEETRIRSENAEYLKSQIEDIPGIIPYKLYDGVTRAVFHLFPFRYDKEQFHGLSRSLFIRALSAEGVPAGSGYATMNTMAYLGHALQSKNFKRIYPAEMLDVDSYYERNRCPENDILCNEEAVRITQYALLGTRNDVDDIAVAIRKIHKHAKRIKDQA